MKSSNKTLMPSVYPNGLPLYWRDEQSGVLAAAVKAYLTRDFKNEPGPTAELLSLVADFLRYFINAPCWRGGDKLQTLRQSAENLRTIKDIDQFVDSCLEIGLDPF